MNIEIGLGPDRQIFEDDEDGSQYLFCRTIFIGGKKNGDDFSESNQLALGFWTIAMYEQQWREGLERIQTHDTSCLIVSIQDPEEFPFINSWILHKIGRKIHIQNRLFFDKTYQAVIGNKLIVPSHCYDILIQPREITDVSEWVVAL